MHLFAVDDRSLQLVWRGLTPGADVVFAPLGEDGRALGEEAKAVVDPEGRPGAVVIDHLPADRSGLVEVSVAGEAVAPVPFRTRPALPGPELARIATISDLHLGAKGFGLRGTIREAPGFEDPHPTRCARAAVAEATDWGAERLVAKGDLTNYGQIEQWRTWAGIVAESEIPVDALPGNHDTDHPRMQHSLSPTDAAAAFGLSMAQPLTVRDLPGTRLVLVDTSCGGRDMGAVAPVLDDVVDAVNDADDNATVLLFLHHHVDGWYGPEGWPRGIPHREGLDFLERIAAAHPRTLVSTGHSHRHRRAEHAGITWTQVGATKDYPGVWAGYSVHDGGVRQLVRRISSPDCLAWTDLTRRAAFGAWRFVGPGPLSSRCFELRW